MDGQDVDDPPIGQEGCSAGVGMRPEMDWTRRTELRRRTRTRVRYQYTVKSPSLRVNPPTSENFPAITMRHSGSSGQARRRQSDERDGGPVPDNPSVNTPFIQCWSSIQGATRQLGALPSYAAQFAIELVGVPWKPRHLPRTTLHEKPGDKRMIPHSGFLFDPPSIANCDPRLRYYPSRVVSHALL
ncbi:hypothetical protein An08g05800 [Aspergillus niger]|uniref:Uncharacterized protein n=2 Tax=Aspergillus niger TaxID=5061 RepID=A2QRF1_ASPNC|nr:hypothetical protein An08g05800 [Aspergillus niger]CAK45552.1 hypothetical protein An08g05800 [Aspergillus niger]